MDAVEISRSVRRADLKAVGEVRLALRELMRHRCPADTAEVAELLITELVTNALVHTDQGAEVSARLAADRLRVEVRDHVSRRPRPYVPTADDGTHGRGLMLVQALADAWGVESPVQAGGKVVWFELAGAPGGLGGRAYGAAYETGYETAYDGTYGGAYDGGPA